jgi:transposase-like protein
MEQNQNFGSASSKQSIQRIEQDILRMIEEYAKSGFSVKNFCEVSDVSETTFHAWLKKYRTKQNSTRIEGTDFAKLEVRPVLVESRPELFAEIGNIKIYKQVPAEYLKALLS